MRMLLDHERKLEEIKALAGTKWQENGLVFPSEAGSPSTSEWPVASTKICENQM